MGASAEAVEAPGEATRASPALLETAEKAPPDSAPGPETARVDDAAARDVVQVAEVCEQLAAPCSVVKDALFTNREPF